MASIGSENIKIALRAIRSQLMRTTLTVVMMAIGIMALVGILTSMDVVKEKLKGDLSMLGTNTFSIRNYGFSLGGGRRGQRDKVYPSISYKEATAFTERYNIPGIASVSAMASFAATVKHESEKTNPNVQVLGVDINYLRISGYELEKGRNFSGS